MSSFTFLWNNETWAEWTRSDRDHPLIDHIGGDNKRPMSNFSMGDEIFIITVKGGDLYLAGRLIVDSKPLSRSEATAALGRELKSKDIYFLGRSGNLDKFRPNVRVDRDVAKELELFTADDRPKRPDVDAYGIDRQTFRAPYRLSRASADLLRAYLDEGASTTVIQLAAEVERLALEISKAPSGMRETEVNAWAKRRLCQGAFRSALFPIFGHACALSGISNDRLLIASHIRPWSKCDNEQRRDQENGILLSVAWDALFDKGLISFADEGSVIASSSLLPDIEALGLSLKARLAPAVLTARRREFLKFHRENCYQT